MTHRAEQSTSQPFWSVMMPVYDPDRELLKTALDSVLRQASPPDQMQIEVVDDCSPKVNVESLVRELCGERVQVHRSPRNLGLAGAWNLCIDRAAGQVVHILHQDDLVLPGFYAKLGFGLQQSPEAGLAFCRHRFIGSSGETIMDSELESATPGVLQDMAYRLASQSRIQCPAVVVRRHCYKEAGGFRNDLPYVLDWEMWFRLSVRYQVRYEPEVLACYRMHDSSQTGRLQQQAQDIRDIRRFLEMAASALPDPAGRQAVLKGRRIYAIRAMDIANVLANNHQMRAACLQLRQAWALKPCLELLRGTTKCAIKGAAALCGLRWRPRTA